MQALHHPVDGWGSHGLGFADSGLPGLRQDLAGRAYERDLYGSWREDQPPNRQTKTLVERNRVVMSPNRIADSASRRRYLIARGLTGVPVAPSIGNA